MAGFPDGVVARQADAVYASFVAMGDSFTEGLDDPAASGGYRGWADLVATRLAVSAPPGGGFRYANLAVRGRKFDAVVDDQVPVALRMGPDLVSFAAGGNDVLRPRFDPAPLAARFDDVVRMLAASGARVLLFTTPKLPLPGRQLLARRVMALNAVVRRTAERYGAIVIDLAADPHLSHVELWSEDRLHLSSAGHQRVAAAVLTALAIDADPAWVVAPTAAAPVGWLTARRADLRWSRHHLAPWIGRRLTGRSSGDHLAPKRPILNTYPDPTPHQLPTD